MFICVLFAEASEYEVTDVYSNDWTNFGLRGKVESLTHQTGKPGKDLENFSDTLYYSEEYLKFNENGFCSFIRFKDLSSDEVTVENIFSYSRTGQRLMFAIYGRDAREMFRKVFRYGENGKIVREEITYPQKSSIVSDTVEYIYDTEKNPVKKVTRKASTGKERSVETLTYNGNGAVSVRNTVIYAGKEIKKLSEKYEYDADGRESVREIIDSGKTEKIMTSYTDDGKIAEEIRMVDGIRLSRKVYHYENGICTAELLSDSGNRLSSIIRLSYDAKGNWIRKVTYRFSENSKRIEVYQIEKRDISYRR